MNGCCALHAFPLKDCPACQVSAALPIDDDTILRIASGADDPMRATGICAKAAELVGGERDRTHGTKRENFRKIAAVWNAYLEIRRPGPLAPADVGHMMVLLKVARTQHGAHNLDDYIDIAGYAGCAGEIADADAAPPTS